MRRVVRPSDVCPAYGRAVLGIVTIMIVEVGGGRDGSVGKVVWGMIVRNWSWLRARMGIKERLGAVEVGRIFPTLVRKLRHGPLCKASVEARGPTRVWSRISTRGWTTD